MENDSKIKFIVYCTTNVINKKIYIGVHKTNPEHFDGYIGCGAYINQPSTYSKGKYHFHRAIMKYGVENFKRVTIKEFPNTLEGEEEAYLLEADIVNREFLQRNDIYNTVLGGKSGSYFLNSIACYQYDYNGNFIREYYSYKDASRELEVNMISIQRAVKNKTRCKGFFFTNTKYDKLDLSKMHSYEGAHKKPCYQYNEDGTYECCYESIKDAGRILGIHDSNILKCMLLGTICHHKYFSYCFMPEFRQAKTLQINSCELHLYDLQGNYIASYANLNQARIETGIKTNLYKAIRLKHTAGGYQWSFEKLEKISPIKPKSPRKVGKYDKDWNLIKEYKTLSECKKENGSGMYHVLTGRDLFAKGFRYKYIDD